MFSFFKNKRESLKFVDFKLPIDDIKNDLIIDKNKYKLVLKVSPINTELETFEELEKISASIQSAFSSFRGRFGIYIMSEKADVKKNIDNLKKLMKEKNSIIDKQILKEQKKHLENISKTARSILAFYLVIEMESRSLEIAEQTLNDSYLVIKQELANAQIFVSKLCERDILCLIGTKISPRTQETRTGVYNLGLNLDHHFFKDVSSLKPVEAELPENGVVLKIEDKYFRFYSIINLPQKVEAYCWLKKLFSFHGDINIAIILTPKRKDKVLSHMSKSISENEGFAYSKSNVAMQKRYLEKAESARKIIDDISREDIELLNVNIFISIASYTIDELDSLNALLLGKISSMYMKATGIIRKEFEPFYSMLPILVENKLTEKLVYNLTTRDVASLIPFDQCEYMEDSGIIVGDNISSGGSIVVNFRNKIYNNSNMVLIAESGSGKTTFLKTMQIRNIPYVDYTIVFDIKGEFDYKFAKKYTFSPESDLIANPFHIRSAFAEREINVGRYLAQKIMELIVFFKWIIPQMSPYEESIFEDDIRECYRRCGLDFKSEKLPEKFCTLQTLSEVMEEKLSGDLTSLEKERREYIKACLNPYIKGAYSEIFNGHTNWDFNKFTILDISNTPEAVKKPLYDILLKDTWQFAKKDGTNPEKQSKKDIYIDEAHEFADERNLQTFEFLSRKLVKEGRGFGVRTITATQNLSDFLALEKWGQGILDNSYFKFFMKLGENDMAIASKLYKFSKAELRVVEGSDSKGKSTKGKGILCISRQKMLVQVVPTKKEWTILEGNYGD